MGIKESFPIIRGKAVKFNLPEEEKYFERSRKLTKIFCFKNEFSDYNLIKSLEVKNFVGGKTQPKKEEMRDMTWIEYIKIHLHNLYYKYQAPWIPQFLNFLNNKNINISEKKYCSNAFYYEYQLLTLSQSIIPEIEKISKVSDNIHKFIEQEGESEPEYHTPGAKFDKEYLEIDVVDNFGGSYLKFDQGEIPIQYRENRKKVKYYVNKIKEDLYNNEDHPLHLAIKFFNEEFGKYITQKIKGNEENLNKKIFDQKQYELDLKNFQEEIDYCLKEVITKMYSALKLFYSTTIDLAFLEEEKDDLFNLVISTFFRIGNLYENIAELYNKCFQNEFTIFQERLLALKNVNPKQLGLETKFCLNEDSFNLKLKLKEKYENGQQEEEIEDQKEVKKDNLEIINEDDKERIPSTIKIETILKEKKEEEENNIKNEKTYGILNNLNIIKNKYNKTENDLNKINLKNYYANNPIRSKTRSIELPEDENNVLEDLSNIDSSKYDYFNNYDPNEAIRNTVDNFNQKKYFFPDIKETLINNVENSTYINNKKSSNTPYFSAINLLKSINKYKTPFEKIILLASISDQIMESATNYWKGMEKYIKKDFLYIDADEILKIFLYIIIQTQMPEILIECKIIENFTSELTKTFNVSYNYTLLEASIDYINGKNNINELNEKGNILEDASSQIMTRTSQRLSRFSNAVLKNE